MKKQPTLHRHTHRLFPPPLKKTFVFPPPASYPIAHTVHMTKHTHGQTRHGPQLHAPPIHTHTIRTRTHARTHTHTHTHTHTRATTSRSPTNIKKNTGKRDIGHEFTLPNNRGAPLSSLSSPSSAGNNGARGVWRGGGRQEWTIIVLC
jgi:hypothetical protein